MRYVVLVAVLLLAGCATPKEKFEAAWPKLVGQPIGVLYDRWGPPERVVDTETARRVDTALGVENTWGPLYVWNVSSSFVFTNTTTSTGMIGTTPVSITTSTPDPQTYYCNVRVRTTEERKISRIQMTGANGPCQRMADRL